MKLLEAITLVAKGDRQTSFDVDDINEREHIEAAHRFLFNKSYSKKEKSVTPQTTALIDVLKLQGNDFSFIGNGANGTVYGNDKIVFRLESNGGETKMPDDVAIENIPKGLATEIINAGECNGIKYTLCKRLNTKHQVTAEEIIPFLFKARDAGVTYNHAAEKNFGYNETGGLEVLDHEHFEVLSKPRKNFEESLDYVLKHSKNVRFPLLTFDDRNTYVAFNPRSTATPEYAALKKKLLASLHAVGINDESIEDIKNPPVVKIARTEVTYGTPPQTEELADYLERSLRVDIKAEMKADVFVQNMSGILKDIGGRVETSIADLPAAEKLAVMDRKSFLEFYDGFIQSIEKSGACSAENIARIDSAFDTHFKAAYPPQQKSQKI